MSLQLYLWAIQGYRITSTISQPAIPSPVHTQGSPVTCNTDVFQRTFATRNHISVVFVTFVRHDCFVILDANPLIHCSHLHSGYTSVVGAWGQGILVILEAARTAELLQTPKVAQKLSSTIRTGAEPTAQNLSLYGLT